MTVDRIFFFYMVLVGIVIGAILVDVPQVQSPPVLGGSPHQ